MSPAQATDRIQNSRAPRDSGLRNAVERSAFASRIRRYRRPLAAVCAGLAVLLTISALNAPQPAASAMGMDLAPRPAIGEIAAPITLASAAIASSLEVGDIIDLVAIPTTGTGRAQVVARRARVLNVGDSGGFGASESALVVVAVPELDALAMADATVDSELTALIH